MKNTVLILMGLLLGGCGVRKHTMVAHTRVDSLFTEKKTTYKDTLFSIPKSAVTLALPVLDARAPLIGSRLSGFNLTTIKEQPVAGRSIAIQKEKARARLTVKTIRDTVFIDCECDTLTLKAQIRQVYEKQFKQEKTTEKKQEHKTQLPLWGWSIIALLALLVVLLLKRN